MLGRMVDEQPRPATPRRRRTALVTSRWAASAAVIAAMTATGATAAETRTGEIDVSTVAFADPPEELEDGTA